MLWSKRFRGLVLFVPLFFVPSPGAASCRDGQPCIGLNRFELGHQFVVSNWAGRTGSDYDQIAKDMATKTLNDTLWDGGKFLRFSASEFGPITYDGDSMLTVWKNNPGLFFARLDKLFDEADARGVLLVPSLIWNPVQFAALAGRDGAGKGETTRDLFSNFQSRSYLLASKWVRDFVERYQQRSSILFWELGNEWNLSADQDLLKRCAEEFPRNPEVCEVRGNYTTADMIRFAESLRRIVKELDPSRAISTGYGYPTPYAQKLRSRPEWGPGGPDTRDDTESETERNLRDIHANFEILSVHHYPSSRLQQKRDRALLQYAQDYANRTGRKLFVGEYGGPATVGQVFTESAYLTNTLLDIVSLRIPYSAAWSYQFYQFEPDVPNEYNIEQGYTDTFLAQTRQYLRIETGPIPEGQGSPPAILVTSPPSGETFETPGSLFALASDDSGRTPVVQLLRGEQVVQELVRPPYRFTVDPQQFEFGLNRLSLRACDSNGLCNFQPWAFFRPGGAPQTPVTCSLAPVKKRKAYLAGETVPLDVQSNPSGLRIFVTTQPADLTTRLESPATPSRVQVTLDSNEKDRKIEVRATLKDERGEVKCTTNPVYIRVRQKDRDLVLMEQLHRLERLKIAQ